MKKIHLLTLTLFLLFLSSCNTNNLDDGRIRLTVTPLEIIFPYDNKVHSAEIHVKSNTSWSLTNSGNMQLSVSQISGYGDATITISEQMPEGQISASHNSLDIKCQDGTKDGISWHVDVYRDGRDFKW